MIGARLGPIATNQTIEFQANDSSLGLAGRSIVPRPRISQGLGGRAFGFAATIQALSTFVAAGLRMAALWCPRSIASRAFSRRVKHRSTPKLSRLVYSI